MAILKRFGDIMRANINALLDKAEDPAKMVDQMLLDLNEDLAAVKKETASVMAAATNAQQHVNEATEKTSRASRNSAAFERMEEKADRMLNEANATAELNTQASNEDIANKYLAGGSTSVDDELARLKAEVGVEEQQQAANN